MNNLKLMVNAKEAMSISNSEGKINIKKLINEIECDLIKASSTKVIDGEEENLLANIKQDIIEAAIEGKKQITIPGINHSENHKNKILKIIEENKFQIKETPDSKFIISWE